jgi:fido (protein-threonine AMPylation protein)
VGFRTAPAYAKRGREMYPLQPRMQDTLERLLADTTRSREPLAVRAARVYLDVCFFHPFVDGNARAARLALDHVLTRDGYALHAAQPIFALARAADDAHGAWNLARVIDLLIGQRA